MGSELLADRPSQAFKDGREIMELIILIAILAYNCGMYDARKDFERLMGVEDEK